MISWWWLSSIKDPTRSPNERAHHTSCVEIVASLNPTAFFLSGLRVPAISGHLLSQLSHVAEPQSSLETHHSRSPDYTRA